MTLTLVVGTNTWIDLADADLYFEGRLNSAAWDAATDVVKNKALVTAFNQLDNSEDYSFPATVALITASMTNGQCEQSLFMLLHIDSFDRRIGIQAQGVKEAGIVKEKYVEEMMGKYTVCPQAKTYLKGYETGKMLFINDLDRDSNEDADTSI